MKALLKQALSQCSIHISSPMGGETRQTKEDRKQKALLLNRRSGQLKRLRNARYQRISRTKQSWKLVNNKPRRKSKEQPSSPRVTMRTQEAAPQLLSLAKQIVRTRNSLFGGTTRRVLSKKEPKSILFADETFRQHGRTVKDIVCS
ncbi:hypothetical protein CRM22_000001 [Opisthorchis felineus]|uniref:Uncharacterized protein n=1 Tax=Opisthorchis felineus TaxID=147828 RepID=A0A4S2MGZ4_OPIFE|nr:hypothetical protein CRM22_000001 [Opisthorchis felineus]